ncbi:MAG: undecaprenyldiphospho-muramoylpentapeptide beta-N-acetylglucosaminyltransferase [Thiotrichales bacterium]|nr:undecaprenyldiphospho-muramoylpentapeptide beta-N-acetylglucosaminyltransferase [Thiotrichales bacterium]
MLPESVMILAGGTGGHVYPALAVAACLREQGVRICWVGTRSGLEYRVVPENGFAVQTIRIRGLRGKGLLRWCLAPAQLAAALFESLLIMHREKPAVVLGMGGFVSGPGGVAAWLLRIPLCIHEQNARAGLTNRLLRPLARVVLQAFPDSFAPGDKVHATGNPVRHEILNLEPPEQRLPSHQSDIHLLIIGGSLGALQLNRVVPNALCRLGDEFSFSVRHQTGPGHLTLTREQYETCQVDAEIIDYIKDMAAAYAWADLVVCRAGAMTIAELTAVGIGSILVPFPYAVDDHQTANARFLSENDCAVLISESDLSSATLAQALGELCRSRDRLLAMAKRCRSLARPRATEDVAAYCLEVACA